MILAIEQSCVFTLLPDVCMFTKVFIAGCVWLPFKKDTQNALQASA